MMKFKDFFDFDSNFRNADEIKASIRNSRGYENEGIAGAKLLKFFSTSKQRTYLVGSNAKLYCVLDDSRKSAPHVNWSMSYDQIFSEGGLILSLSTKDKSQNTGLVDFGPNHKEWLYTKSLFKGVDIKEKLSEFLTSLR